MSDYVLEINLRGPRIQNERGYWDRERLADATLAVQPADGWDIYLSSIEKAITPTFAIKSEDD